MYTSVVLKLLLPMKFYKIRSVITQPFCLFRQPSPISPTYFLLASFNLFHLSSSLSLFPLRFLKYFHYVHSVVSFIFSFVDETNRTCPRTGLCLFHLLHLLGHQKIAVHSFARMLHLHIVLLLDGQPLKRGFPLYIMS